MFVFRLIGKLLIQTVRIRMFSRLLFLSLLVAAVSNDVLHTVECYAETGLDFLSSLRPFSVLYTTGFAIILRVEKSQTL